MRAPRLAIALAPWVVLAWCLLSAGRGADALRDSAARAQETCARGAFQGWLTAAVGGSLPEDEVAYERAILQAMSIGGRRRLDRFVVARALGADDAPRYADDALMLEADEAALGQVLADSSAFRRVVREPAPARESVPSHPQYLAPDAAPETANDLLEALREAPKPAAPVRPRPAPVDVLGMAARFVVVLRPEPVRSAAFLSVYEERPDAMKQIFSVHRDDPDFRRRFTGVVVRNLLVDLEARLRGVFVGVATALAADGHAYETLELAATRDPASVARLFAERLPRALQVADMSGWALAQTGESLVAMREAGHFSFRVTLPVVDLLLGTQEVPDDLDTAQPAHWEFRTNAVYFENREIRIVRACHGPLCFPETAAGVPR